MLEPRNYRDILDISADGNNNVAAPAQGTPVSQEMRSLLPFMASWTQWPDSERVRVCVGMRAGILGFAAAFACIPAM